MASLVGADAAERFALFELPDDLLDARTAQGKGSGEFGGCHGRVIANLCEQQLAVFLPTFLPTFLLTFQDGVC